MFEVLAGLVIVAAVWNAVTFYYRLICWAVRRTQTINRLLQQVNQVAHQEGQLQR